MKKWKGIDDPRRNLGRDSENHQLEIIANYPVSNKSAIQSSKYPSAYLRTIGSRNLWYMSGLFGMLRFCNHWSLSMFNIRMRAVISSEQVKISSLSKTLGTADLWCEYDTGIGSKGQKRARLSICPYALDPIHFFAGIWSWKMARLPMQHWDGWELDSLIRYAGL